MTEPHTEPNSLVEIDSLEVKSKGQISEGKVNFCTWFVLSS